jgi:hypothetical protein
MFYFATIVMDLLILFILIRIKIIRLDNKRFGIFFNISHSNLANSAHNFSFYYTPLLCHADIIPHIYIIPMCLCLLGSEGSRLSQIAMPMPLMFSGQKE